MTDEQTGDLTNVKKAIGVITIKDEPLYITIQTIFGWLIALILFIVIIVYIVKRNKYYCNLDKEDLKLKNILNS